jgi:Spy/CpxP family protein refolding chaperone
VRAVRAPRLARRLKSTSRPSFPTNGIDDVESTTDRRRLTEGGMNETDWGHKSPKVVQAARPQADRMDRHAVTRGLVALAILAGASVGCAESAAPPATAGGATAASSSADEVAPSGPEAQDNETTSDELKAHHRHRHGSFAMFALMSIETLGVSPEQQAQVEQIKSDLRAQLRPAHQAHAALLTTLADGIAAGNVDAQKVDAAAAQVAAAAAQVHVAAADALNRLHAVLTPPQRAALADKVEAHFRVWKGANSEEGPAESGHMAHLATELGLSPDQTAKAQATFASSMATGPAGASFDPKAAEAHVQAFGQAFAGDPFDAKTLGTADRANVTVATWGATRLARFYEAVSPVLTPDQRAKLAAMLREHANQQQAK